MEETKINAQPIDSKIPEGPIAEKWTNYKSHLAQRGGCRRTCQTGTHDDDVEFALVGGVDEFLMRR